MVAISVSVSASAIAACQGRVVEGIVIRQLQKLSRLMSGLRGDVGPAFTNAFRHLKSHRRTLP